MDTKQKNINKIIKRRAPSFWYIFLQNSHIHTHIYILIHVPEGGFWKTAAGSRGFTAEFFSLGYRVTPPPRTLHLFVGPVLRIRDE